MTVKETVKVDVKRRRGQIEGRIAKIDKEMAENIAANVTLNAEKTDLETLLSDYNSGIPAPAAAPEL